MIESYITSARFYSTKGKLIAVDNTDWFLQRNAVEDAKDWLEQDFDLTPCNISVRGPDGRFVKWKN